MSVEDQFGIKPRDAINAILSAAKSSDGVVAGGVDKDVGMRGSNRVRIAVVAVGFVILYEICLQNGIQISNTTMYLIEGILALLGLSDGQRRLGRHIGVKEEDINGGD